MELKKLIIKQLRIISTAEKAAKTINFHPERNLILGKNDVGKSTIIKSIYHTLGADAYFVDTWKNLDPIYLLNFSFDGVDFWILRARDHFGFFDAEMNLVKSFESIIKGLSPFLANLFKNKLKLKQSKTNRRIPISPAIQFLPFYVDQDKGWASSWNSFEGLSTFESRGELIEFVTGVKPNHWYTLSEKIESLKSEIKKLKSEYSTLLAAKKTVSKHIPKSTFNSDIGLFKKEIAQLISKLDGLKKLENDYRRKLVKLRSQEAFIENEIDVLNKSIREINKDYQHSLEHLSEEITCPTCNAVYENSMISRFGLLDDIETCRELLADYLDERKELHKKILSLEVKLKLQRKKVEEIQALLAEQKGKLRLKDVIQNESAKQVRQVFMKGENEYELQISQHESDESALTSKRSALHNKERKTEILNRFNSLLDSFLMKLNVKTLNSTSTRDIPKTVRSQGSDTPRALLAYYYAILYTSREFAGLSQFPLVIDSPVQQEQDEDNGPKILNFILENTPSDVQLILGTVDLYSVDYKGHVIKPEKPYKLLDSEEYDESYKIIMPLVDRVHESIINRTS